MKSLLYLTMLAFIMTSVSGQNNCRGNLDRIQTGSIAAFAPGFPDSNREHTFTVPITLFTATASGVQIATSLSESVFSSFMAKGYDFSLRSFQGQNSNQIKIVLLIDNDNSWTSMKISYLISGRSDVRAGFFIADTFAHPNAQIVTKTITVALPGWSAQTNSVFSSVQLAGLRSSSSSPLNIQILNSIIDSNTGLMTVQLKLNSSSLVEFVYLSYLWWVNSQNLVVAAYNPTSGLAVEHQFTGISQISNNRMVYTSFSLSGPAVVGSIPCKGQRCSSSCVLITQCVAGNGIIANNVCYLCGQNQYYQNFQCVDITCPPNMIVTQGQCICPSGFTLTAPNECSPCPVHAKWNGKQCQCDIGYYLQNTTCLPCPASSHYNQDSQSCVCDAGYNWLEGTCIKCGDKQKWDAQTKSCACIDGFERVSNLCVEKCPENTNRIGLTCRCNSGLRNDSNKCVPCPPQSVFIAEQNTCLCGMGLFFYNNSCISCQKNQLWNSLWNRCDCIQGFNKIDGSCQQCINSTWNGKECACKDGYERINSTSCIQCDKFKAWNGSECACKNGFIGYGSLCFCPLGSLLVEDKCLCSNGMVPVSGSCQISTPNLVVSAPVICPTNEELQNGSCVCISNYVRVNGVCTVCPEKSASDGSKCVCIRGLFMIGGKCGECPKNTFYNETTKVCLCKEQFYGTAPDCKKCHKDCQSCLGPNSNQCLSCDKGSTLKDGTCIQDKNKDKSDKKNQKRRV